MSPITVPVGFKLHTENTSSILLAADEAFLNPVQEFNRDTSVACIRVWSEDLNRTKEAKWRKSLERKATSKKLGNKRQKVESTEAPLAATEPVEETVEASSSGLPPAYKPREFVILEALSATGLRSIRYAKEIPLVKYETNFQQRLLNEFLENRYVIANDLSPAAASAMKRNIDLNELASDPENPKVRINEGDACTLMYSHREDSKRVDVVDLDPYGTAAPFLDAAVQCVSDGGLLCVTCTDMGVLAATGYPEKCYSNYGGVPLKAEYCHEAALRLVLHAISSSAARYGRVIEPLLSLSIDFYVRLFVRIQSSPVQVKRAVTKTAIYYVCTSCQSPYEQPLGRIHTQVHEASGNANSTFKTQAGPPVGEKCTECGSALHLAGPMWSGPLHDPGYVGRVLEHLETHSDRYGTSTRMKGMLTVAKEELDTPFYFTPSKVASFFHCETPSLNDVASALLHAGHTISRSHACPGSLKTSAPRQVLHDVFRSWVKLHPVKMENISENSPARRLLSVEPRFEANFTRHANSVTASSKVKLVRYQENPTSHWGPGTKPGGSKRKRMDGEE